MCIRDRVEGGGVKGAKPKNHKGDVMRRTLMGLAALLTTCSAPALAQDALKIGFVGTFSGPAASIGIDMRDAFELALDHLGRKVGGLPAQVVYEDDQQKPEVGKQKTAYEIGVRLVGSEMCIRDRGPSESFA